MAVPSLPHTSPDHDEYLIARLAAGDVDGREADTARARVAECPACADLLSDLIVIAASTASLPTPRRTRDFRLTVDDAARLRRTSWRRALAALGEPRFAFTRPLATGLAALGIAGLVLASLPSGFGAGSAALPAIGDGAAPAPAPAAAPSAGLGSESDRSGAVAGEAPSAAPSSVPGAVSPAPSEAAAEPLARDTAGKYGTASGQPGTGVPASGSSGPSPLIVLSVGLLAAGVVLGILRLVARRT